MYGVPPINPNVVTIPIIQTGCCSYIFDPTFPVHLNGIIHPDEYQQSIEKINRTIPSKRSLLICSIVFGGMIFIGFCLFIAGGIESSNSHTFGFPPLIGVAIGLVLFGMITFCISILLIQSQTSAAMTRVVAEESSKYSNRTPVPCSWRLYSWRVYTHTYHRPGHSRLVYHLVIEIGNRTVSNCMPALQPPPSDSIYLEPINPPAYHQLVHRFCQACGATRLDPNASFCLSCGQAYDKF